MALDLVQQHLSKGELDKGVKLLNRFLKKNKLSTAQKIETGMIYLKMSQLHKAVKLLGPVLSLTELECCTELEIKRQIRLAHMFGVLRCRYAEARIFDNLVELGKRKGVSPAHWDTMFTAYYLYHLANAGKYQDALENINKEIETGKLDDGLIYAAAEVQKDTYTASDRRRSRIRESNTVHGSQSSVAYRVRSK
jgi:tetratricopeptide (TPR) repeat protein